MHVSFDDLLAIGVDIGGTSVKIALVGRGPSILSRRQLPMEPGAEAEVLLTNLVGVLDDIWTERPGSRNLPIGVGCAGLIDAESGVVRTSPNLPAWRDVPLVETLFKMLGPGKPRRTITLDNDANAFSIAEGFHGAAKDHRNAVFVTLGTGVGGGLKFDGQLYAGSCGFAGEIGHMTVDPDGPVCACGNRGCLESFAGSARIVRRARRMIEEEGRESEWLRGNLSSLDDLSAKDLGEAANAGNEIAMRAFGEAGEYLGIVLAGLINLLNPEVIVIGGGVANAGEPLFSAVRAAVTRRAMGPSSKCVEIVPAELGEDAGVIGAAMKAASCEGSRPHV